MATPVGWTVLAVVVVGTFVSRSGSLLEEPNLKAPKLAAILTRV